MVPNATAKSADGGRGSAKSDTFAQIGILRMANMLPWYPEKPVRLASVRQFQNSIAESMKIVIEHYIKEFDLQDEFEIHKFAIDHVDGSHMFFPGFDRNPEAFLGIEGVNVLWVEQADPVGSEMEKVIPTFIRTPGIELWFSWNAEQT